MKNIFTLITLCLFCSFFYGQTIYLSKDFNDLSLSSGGWTTQVVVDTTNWYASDYNGDQFAKISNYTNGNVPSEAWLISPSVDLTNASQPNLSFGTIMKFAGAALTLYISTDYVFDGTGSTAFAPDHETCPLGAYGRSKQVGERGVVAAGGKYAILRTSWVYSRHGKNFLKTMLRLSETRDQLGIVNDQIGGPTPAAAIAAACYAIAGGLLSGSGGAGIYHFSGMPEVSWADFAAEIFAQSGRQVTITEILTQDYPTPAKRPLNSRLNCDSLKEQFGILRPDWRTGLEQLCKDIEVN